MSKEIFMLLGAPCSGKGTQCNLLQNIITCLTVGNMLREKYKEGTPERIRMDNGEMVNEEEVDKVVQSFILAKLTNSSKILIDGYPRSPHQARSLINMIKTQTMENNMEISGTIILLDTDNYEALRHRMLTRKYCLSCQKTYDSTIEECCESPLSRRKDDEEEIFIKRLNYYKETIEEICRTVDSTISIGAMNSVQDIHKIIKSIIKDSGTP